VGSEQGQWQGALGNRQDAIARAMQHHEHRGEGAQQRGAGQQQSQCRDGMGCGREAGRVQRVNVSEQAVLGQPAGDLGWPHQRRDADCGTQAQSGQLQQVGQMGGHGGADEPGDGKDRGQGQGRTGARSGWLAVLWRAASGHAGARLGCGAGRMGVPGQCGVQWQSQ
jgi:hypothetical protein